MRPGGDNVIRFDFERGLICGPGFTIRHSGQWNREDEHRHDLFDYEDETIRCRFRAERAILWDIRGPWEHETYDSGVFRLYSLGDRYEDFQALRKLSDTTLRTILANIEHGLYFDISTYYDWPPDRVLVDADAIIARIRSIARGRG